MTDAEVAAQIAHWWEWEATVEESTEQAHADRIAAALSAARDEGEREMREKAAKIFDNHALVLEMDDTIERWRESQVLRKYAVAIRSLLLSSEAP